MPARDGTGPFGTGPVGRGLGPCAGNGQETGFDQPFGMGMAHRRGRRHGSRGPRWGRNAWTDIDEQQALKNRQNWLKEQLDAVTHQIEELDKPAE